MTLSITPAADERATRFLAFLERLRADVYPEPPSVQHTEFTRMMWAKLREVVSLPPGARVLDVGCGQGLALELFREAGLDAVGITIGSEDLAACAAHGFHAVEMDQSFLDFPPASFDLIWCRHALEHSVAPYFTLAGFHEALKPGGILYVEVPAPDTACHHETNPNHYSVLGRSLWLSLMQRAGFELLDGIQMRFEVPAGPDMYWAFILRKGAPGGPGAGMPVLPAAEPADGRQDVEVNFEAGGREHTMTLRLRPREYSEGPMLEALAGGSFYEPEVSYFLTNILEPGDTFIDVGGHVGYFTTLAAQVVGPTGRVYTFEPEAGNAARIREHLALNGLANVELFEQAVAEARGEVSFHVNADNSGGHALWDVGEHPDNPKSRAGHDVRTVPQGTLTDLLVTTQGQRVRVIKVDAEGAELRVLMGGMLLVMAREVPFIICEINEFALRQLGATGRGVRAFMAAWGYHCYLMSATEPCLVPYPPEREQSPEFVYNVLFTTQPV